MQQVARLYLNFMTAGTPADNYTLSLPLVHWCGKDELRWLHTPLAPIDGNRV